MKRKIRNRVYLLYCLLQDRKENKEERNVNYLGKYKYAHN